MKKKKEIKKIVLAANETYEGEVDDNGKPDGKGKWKFSDGTQLVYEGEFLNNHGFGTFTFPDGATYEGDIITKPSKDPISRGNFVRHGKGKFIWPNGQIYIGNWLDGKMHGHGSITYPKGDKYEGNFKNEKRHGYGIYIYKDGSKDKGMWHEGEFVEVDESKKN